MYICSSSITPSSTAEQLKLVHNSYSTKTPTQDTDIHTRTHTSKEYTRTRLQNAAMYRKSARDHARSHRGHVEPQSETRTHPTLADVLLASDQSIHT